MFILKWGLPDITERALNYESGDGSFCLSCVLCNMLPWFLNINVAI